MAGTVDLNPLRIVPFHDNADVSVSNPLPVVDTPALALLQTIANNVTSGGTGGGGGGGVTQVGPWNVGINNWPSSQTVTVASGSVTLSGTSAVSGTVSIGNTPAVTVTSGNIGITGTPTVTVSSGTVGISGTVNTTGSVSITNSPTVTVGGTANVAGTVAISGTPAVTISGTPTISGTVSISGTPSVNAAVTGSVNVTPMDGLISTASGTTATQPLTWSPQVGASANYLDTAGYPAISMQISQPSGTLINFQESSDLTNWSPAYIVQAANGNSLYQLSGVIASPGTGFLRVGGQRYFRIYLATYGGSSPAITATLRTTVAPTAVSASLSAAIPTGTNSIGSVVVGGTKKITSLTPTLVAGAYSAGNCIGTYYTFTAFRVTGGSGYLVAPQLTCKITSFIGPVDMFIFSQVPNAGGYTDRAAFNLHNTDAGNLLGVRHLTDVTATGTGPVILRAPFEPLAVYNSASANTLFGVLVTRSAVTTTGTTDFTIQIAMEQD